MNDAVVTEAGEKKLRDLALAGYILQAIGLFIGLTWVVAVVIAYLKAGESRGTWVASHFDWQLRTFWIGLAGMVLAWLLMIVKIGFLVAMAVTVWAIYRIVKGWLALNDRKPLPATLV